MKAAFEKLRIANISHKVFRAKFSLLLQHAPFVVDQQQFYRKRFAPDSYHGQNLTPCRFAKDWHLQPRIAALAQPICEELRQCFALCLHTPASVINCKIGWRHVMPAQRIGNRRV